MKKFTIASLALAAALAIIPAASATPISGSIVVNGFGDTWNGIGITFVVPLGIAEGSGTLSSIPSPVPSIRHYHSGGPSLVRMSYCSIPVPALQHLPSPARLT